MLNKIPNWALLLLPAILFWMAWPPVGLFVFLFVGFIPLFEIEKRNRQKKFRNFFIQTFIALLLWNIAITWWVWNSTVGGAIVMLLLNSLFMAIPWILFRISAKKLGNNAIYLFIIYWITYEYLHHRWDLSWPWLTLGNGLSGAPWLVQWYDITGTLGGSAFVLGMAILLYQYVQTPSIKRAIYPIVFFVFVLASSVFNQYKYTHYVEKKTDSVRAVIMQSNFDPWNEKFVRDPLDLMREMEELSATKLDSNTELLLWPETSITMSINVNHPQSETSVLYLKQFRNKYPKLNILCGADMYRIYPQSAKRPSSTARHAGDATHWWDAYNSAFLLNNQNGIAFYHKSILVPGTEQMPFLEHFPFLEKLAISVDSNSISGSLGKSDSVIVFKTGKLKIAPAICYEGIYGNHVANFVNAGANVIAIITNDAWWKNTPIYTQHLFYGRLRAIEQRKWVLRSANSGISCFINPTGEIVNTAKKFEKTAIKQTVYLNNYKTLYSRLGDLSVLIILNIIAFVLFYFTRKKIEN
jgi:apolipoprotein N-acyltransferase